MLTATRFLAKSLILEPGGVLVMSVPAKVMRELSGAEIEGLARSAAEYCERACEHK